MNNIHRGSEKSKLLIVISDDLFVRNYITSDALSSVKEEYDCTFLVSKKISHKDSFSDLERVVYYNSSKQANKVHFRIFNLLMWHNRSKSKSFRFRIKRTNELSFQFLVKTHALLKLIKIAWRLARYLSWRIFYWTFSNRFIFPFYFNYLKSNLPINQDIEKAITSIEPSLVLFPSSAYDPDGNDVMRVCNQRKISTLFLIDNWDNLSSKSLFWVKPAFIGVWGEQSAKHAIDIQGFDKEQITSLGTPRYDQYFRLRQDCLAPHFDFKYILFVGAFMPFDEVGALVQLNDIFVRHQDDFAGVKILYRPHPWRANLDSIIGMDLEYVVLDPQLADSYTKKDYSVAVQPSIEYYPSLLQNAEFVVGGMTSMLIEALIFRKHFLALVYDDGKHLTSPSNVLKNCTHFEGLENVEGINFCDHLTKLESVLLDVWAKRNAIDYENLDNQRRYYYYDDARPYAERLSDLCESILNSNNPYGR